VSVRHGEGKLRGWAGRRILSDTKGATQEPTHRADRRRTWRRFLDKAPDDQPRANKLFFGDRCPVDPRTKTPLVLPRLVDQVYAANERRWRVRWTRKLRRDHQFPPGQAKRTVYRYAVTVIRRDWIVPHLDPRLPSVIKKQIARQANRLKLDNVVTGMVDVCPGEDHKTGTSGWAHHGHLTIQLVVDSYEAGLAEIRRVFPYGPDEERGICHGLHVARIYDAMGWDRYQDKLLQLGGVRRRIVESNAETGERLPSRKPPLRRAEQIELLQFMSALRADDLMIWVRYRRYNDRVLPTTCNRSKWQNRPPT
jgi:hypothetical protein